MRNGQIVCKCGHDMVYHGNIQGGATYCTAIGPTPHHPCKCRKYRPRRVEVVYILRHDDGRKSMHDAWSRKHMRCSHTTWHRVEVLVLVKQTALAGKDGGR